jgi:hypothetical protein
VRTSAVPKAHGENAAVAWCAHTNIKSEYDFNVSQRVYVSKKIWAAVTKLKDQNIYIINQLAAMCAATSSFVESQQEFFRI